MKCRYFCGGHIRKIILLLALFLITLSPFMNSSYVWQVKAESTETQLTDVYSDYGLDLNDNGLFDYLVFTIGVNVTVEGTYTASVYNLLDSSDNIIDISKSAIFDLVPGVQNISVFMSGTALFSSGANGPYTISYLTLRDSDFNLLDWRDNPYTTINAYSSGDFEEGVRAGDITAAMGFDSADMIGATFSVDKTAGAVVSGSVGFLAPTEGDTFVMLSTGNAQPEDFDQYEGWIGTPDDLLSLDNGNPGGTGPLGGEAYDIVTLHLTLRAPDWAKSLSFDFQFMSEEYPEFVGSDFNDFFSCLLNGTNIAFDTEGNIINVNNNFFDNTTTPAGTVFDGTTVLLTSKAAVTGGATIELDFIVGDVGDPILDTAVFLDNFHFSTEEIDEPVTVPTIWSSDSSGNKKNTFAPTETVYVVVPATGKTVHFYIVAEKDVWNDGDLLIDVSNGAEQLTLNPGPGIQVVPIWVSFLTPGNYDIIEDINNNGIYDAGADGIDSVAEVGFTIEYLSPVAYFTYSPESSIILGEVITFDASGSYDPDGSIVSYDWDFGEPGATGSGEIVSYSYADDGIYTVTLTVTDDDYETAATSVDITVLSDPIHNLDTGLDYSTIQAAIDAPQTLAGHTIFVDNGIYYETVVVNKSISLIGQNRINTIIDGSESDYAEILVTIAADNVEMSGFTVTNAGFIGINVEGSQYCEVHKNIVCFTGDRGIVFSNGGHNSAYDNVVYNSSTYGAIEAISSNNNTIYNNSVYFNQWGIATNHGSYNLIYNNTIYSNTGSGINIDWTSIGNMIYNNNISLNANSGISFLNQASENIIRENDITGNNGCGISFDDSSNNIIYHNNFVDNQQQVHDRSWNELGYPASINIWDDGYPSGGNYWSDYTDIDLYSGPSQSEIGSDGIWDHPYVIDGNNQDNYPVFGRANVDVVLVIDRSGSMAWYGDVIHHSSGALTPDWSKIDTFDIDSSVTTFDVVLETISGNLQIKSPAGTWYGYDITDYHSLDYEQNAYIDYTGAEYVGIYENDSVEQGTWEVYANGPSGGNYELTVQVPPVRINEARDAAKYLLDLMSDGDQLGLVSFAADASLDKQLTLLNTKENRDSLRSAIDSLSIGGGTAMGDGMYVAKEELLSERNRFGAIPAMVVFTDGVVSGGSDPLQRANEAKDAGIKIYLIGLGRVDDSLLTEIKDITRGDYLYAPSASELKSMYLSMIATAKGWSTIMSERETVEQDEINEREVMIDSTVLEASFSVDWTVGDLDLTLKRPDNSLIDPAVAEMDPTIRYAGAATYEIYNLKSPMPGTWTIIVTGMDVSPEGESYNIQVTAQTTVTLTLATDKSSYIYPEPAKIMATLEDTGSPSTGADVEVIVKRPDESQISITLFDDGSDAHGDIIVNDGVYTNYFTQYSEDGSYTLKAIAVGTTLVEEDFSREAQETILVSGVPPDVTPPTTLHDYDDLWHTSDLTIALTAIDNLSGIAEIYYSINSGTIETVSEHGQPIITIEGSGNTLEYWSVDNAGNEELPHKMLTGIKLDKTPPACSIYLSDVPVVEGAPVSLDASSSTDNIGIVSYDWVFGDGTTGTGKTETHAYAEPGIYPATLTVTDAAGNSNTDSISITVQKDTDRDGIPDVTDPDDDNDGVNDNEDAFPLDPNETADTDRDGIGNNADTDDDNDGVPDAQDAFPIDSQESLDTDEDGIGNNADTDDDNDGVVDDDDAFPLDLQESLDTDGDGIGNNADTDDDNDQMPDDWEIEHGFNPLDPNDPGGVNVEILSSLLVVVAAFTATTAAILASLSGLGSAFDAAISNLPLAKEIRELLQLYGEKLFETVDRAKLEVLRKAPFITRGEVGALGFSALIATIVLISADAGGLANLFAKPGLVNIILEALISVCVVIIFAEVFEAFCARICHVHKQFKLWLYGIITFLVSGLVFGFPFGSLGITRYKSGDISAKAKGLFVLSKTLLFMMLMIPFAGLLMLGFDFLGEVGLWYVLITVFSSLIPVRPLLGKALFDYRKVVSLAAFAFSGLLLFSLVLSRLAKVRILDPIIYFGVGVVSAVLAAITLYQLRKAHPT
jgi:parallel beta-helix repeat protein